MVSVFATEAVNQMQAGRSNWQSYTASTLNDTKSSLKESLMSCMWMRTRFRTLCWAASISMQHHPLIQLRASVRARSSIDLG
jgi:hypothetical protein